MSRLEKYSWREQEAEFNANIPQFRTAIQATSSDSPVRLHFIHSRSTHANAVPLLLIPPFPFTNLSLTHLINLFTTPDDPARDTPFHLVIPSLPGLGFSDPITSNKRMIPLIADMFDSLMQRLGYTHYLATNAAPSPNSISDIDWRVVNHIATLHPDSCLGVHLVSPSFKAPTMQSAPLEWLKWKTASTFSTPMLGYSQQDIVAFRQQPKQKQVPLMPGVGGVSKVFEPNTLSYALCDSPAGLLLFMLMVLRILGPKHEFSNRDLIQMAELTWLPGPEGTMRLLAHSASNADDLKPGSKRPKVGITAFSGTGARNEGNGLEPSAALPTSGPDVHTCLAWGRSRYHIVSWQRVPGNAGLLAWERPDVLVDGVRKLTGAIVAHDNRLQESKQPGTALLEQVVVDGDGVAPAETSGTTIQAQETSPLPAPADKKDPAEQGQVGEDAKMQRRPPTPMFPLLGEPSRETELAQDVGDASQGSSGGSPNTIRPMKKGRE